jgi:predicted methyltransferase
MGPVAAFVRALAQKHRPLSDDAQDRERFIAAKKVVALALIATLVVLAVRSGWGLVTELHPTSLFEAFYTVLSFADVLVVLISIRSSTSYHAVFRNAGLAVATVLLRLALASPAPWTSGLGVAATVFAIALTTAYERFMPVLKRAGSEGPA